MRQARTARCHVRNSLAYIAAAILSSIFSSASVAAADGAPPDTVLLIKYQSGLIIQPQAAPSVPGVASIKAFSRPARIATQATTPIDAWRVVTLQPGAVAETVRDALLNDPSIELVEFSQHYMPHGLPNDPDFTRQWQLNNTGQTGGTADADIDAPEAWDLQVGSGSVVVAVVDTGVAITHPDLSANIWTNPGEIAGNGIDDDSNGYVDDMHGYDFGNGDNNPSTPPPLVGDMHGTAVAGLIAAVGNNAIGVSGVGWNTKLMPLKIFTDNGGGASDVEIVAAILYAIDNGASVINTSFGSSIGTQVVADAIATAGLSNILVVASAGNDAFNTDLHPVFPADYAFNNIISVAATDAMDGMAFYSNYGAASVDMGAPGDGVYTTTSLTWPVPYELFSGTSASAPMVSGAAALLYAQFPGINFQQVKDRLMYSGDAVGALSGRTVSGRRLNVFNALEVDNQAPAAVVGLAATEVKPKSVTLSWSASGDDGNLGISAYYDLRMSTTPINASNFEQAQQVSGLSAPLVSGSAESFTVKELPSSSTIYFALRVVDNVGNSSAISNMVSATTPPLGPIGIIFNDNMESGSGNWSAAGLYGNTPANILWHLSTHRSNSASTAFYYGTESDFTYDLGTGGSSGATITSVPIDLTNSVESFVSFANFTDIDIAPYYFAEFDEIKLQITDDDGATWHDLFAPTLGIAGQNTMGKFGRFSIDISNYDGKIVRLRFYFRASFVVNFHEGWYIDDVWVGGYGTVLPNVAPVAVLDKQSYDVVAGQPVTFIGSDSIDPEGATLSYRWNFGDGAVGSGVTTVHTYATTGPYTVTLVVNDGGLDSIAATATVTPNRPPVANIGGPYAVHKNRRMQFNGVKSTDPDGNSLWYSWDTGDGTRGTFIDSSPFWVYKQAGTYTASLSVFDGLATSATVTTTVTVVNDPPEAYPGGPYIGLVNQVIAFNGAGSIDSNLDPIVSYRWDFGDGGTSILPSPGHIYHATGIYTATLIVSDGQLESAPASVTVKISSPNQPVADIGGPYQGILNQDVLFSAVASSDPNGDTLSYRWDFGDGSTGTGVSPRHAYLSLGNHTVTLIVNDGTQDSLAVSSMVLVSAADVMPEFSPGGPYTGTVGQAINFTGIVTAYSGTAPLVYSWYFGDGLTGTGANVNHVYNTPGVYQAFLQVSDFGAYPATPVYFLVVVAPAGTQSGVVFHDDLEAGMGNWTVSNYGTVGAPLWHLSEHRVHSPTSALYYGLESTLNYAVGDRRGSMVTSVPIDLTNVALPTVSFYHYVEKDKLDSASFNVTTDGGLTIIPVYGADDSDLYYSSGTGGRMQRKTYDLSPFAGQTIQLIFQFIDGFPVVGNKGEGWVIDDVWVSGYGAPRGNQAPLADIGRSVYHFSANNVVTFDGSKSVDPESSALTYQWNFGDGGTGSGVQPTHTYSAPGNYTVTLTVSDGVLNSAPVTAHVTSNQAPIAAIGGPYDATTTVPLNLDGSGSSDPDGDRLIYYWNFGDGRSAVDRLPGITYTAVGTYTVTLIVSDGVLFSTPVTTTVTVQQSVPTAVVGGPYSGFAGQAVWFSGSQSTDPGQLSLAYMWDFGDGSTGTGYRPTHTYTAEGTYTVSLVVDNGTAASSPATTTAIIAPANNIPVAVLVGPSSGMVGQTLTFDGSGSSDLDQDPLLYVWDFGDGTYNSDPGSTIVTHAYVLSGNYSVSLYVIDGKQASLPAIQLVSIVNLGPPTAVAGGPYNGNTGSEVQFTGAGSTDPDGSPLSYSWDFGDTNTITFAQDFEDATLPGVWVNGSPGWQVDTTQASSGVRSVRSTTISDAQDATLQYSGSFVSGVLRFGVKVSSEAYFDYLRFYVDDVLVEQWSGEIGWTSVSHAINTGTHTLKWIYAKDGSVSTGNDAAWLDNVVFDSNTSWDMNPKHHYAQPGTYTVTLQVSDGEFNSVPVTATATIVPDQDNDGVLDSVDNCTLVANTNQRDSNGDGYGNLCDADLDNNGLVNLADYALFRQSLGGTNADADFNGDGVVNLADYQLIRLSLGKPPGPSGLAP